MEIYTRSQWAQDGDFKAEPGQEIEAGIYEQMLNCITPLDLPAGKARQALNDFDIPVHAGFLMGEPHSQDKKGPLYMAFGMNDYGKGKRYFYLGLSYPPVKLDGEYYYMDCLNAFVNNGLFPASEFEDDAEAIRTAADYEATLYKYRYVKGDRISSQVLYDPFEIFNQGADD